MPTKPAAKKATKPAWIPESVLKKRAKQEEIQKSKNEALVQQRKKNKVTRGIIFKKALSYDKEYKAAERDIVRMRREAKKHGNFFMEPEPKLVLVIRIKGINGVDPKTRKILQLMRLRQINNAVFLRINSASINMLRLVSPYVTFGTPNLKTVRELVYKRGFASVAPKPGLRKQRIPITDNKIVEENLGKFGIVSLEDLIHELFTVGKNFREANHFLWPFKLSAPKGGIDKKRLSFIEGGQYGDREEFINALVRRMN